MKNLQLATTKLEAEFFNEVHALECKYQSQYSKFYEKVIILFLCMKVNTSDCLCIREPPLYLVIMSPMKKSAHGLLMMMRKMKKS